MLSSPFLAEILSFCLSSSALNFSASLTILSISSLESLPLSLVIVILFCLPVDLSAAGTSRSRRNASEIELAQIVVVLGHGTLALVHLDRHSGLVVAVGGEGLGLLGGDGGVPLDQGSHHTSSSLNAERQRGNIEEQQVGHSFAGVTGEDGSLHSSTIGNRLIRVNRLVQFLAIEEVLQELLHLRDPGGASNQHDVVDAALVHLGVAHRLLHWLKCALEEVRAQLLEPGSGDGGVEVDALE